MKFTKDQLIKEEKGFWENMDKPTFYDEHMAKDALAVINGEVMTHDDAVAMTKNMPMKFKDIRFTNEKFVQFADGLAAVVYEATAESVNGSYSATITSVYADRGGKPILVLTTHAMNAEQTATWQKQMTPAGAR